MKYSSNKEKNVWSVAEAKARLSEVLRLSEQQGPQFIGTKKPFVVLPKSEWEAISMPQQPLGQWLLSHLKLDLNLEIPERSEPEREIPFQ